MKEVAYEALALVSIVTAIALGMWAVPSGNWISTCVPLSHVLMKTSAIESSDGFQSIHLSPEKREKQKLMEKIEAWAPLMENEKPFESYQEQKVTVQNSLTDSNVCVSKGFLQHCVFGDSFLRVGSYQICVAHSEGMQGLSNHELLSLVCMLLSLVMACVVLVLVLMRWTDTLQACSRFITFLNYVIPSLAFASGFIMFLGLFSCIIKSIEFSDDKSEFYNEMLRRVFKDYANVGLIHWERIEGIPEVETWAREVVSHMRYFGLGTDFYMALTSAVLILVSCAFLIYKPTTATSYSSLTDARFNGKHF